MGFLGSVLLSGILFGLGLGFSQMIDRERVLSFLDLFGRWDPTLLFVLGGAVGVTVLSFRWILKMSHPVFAQRMVLPQKKEVDTSLIIGSAIFGVGWGISGYCPGPGITALVLGEWNPVVFLVAFLLGSWTYEWVSPLLLKSPKLPVDPAEIQS